MNRKFPKRHPVTNAAPSAAQPKVGQGVHRRLGFLLAAGTAGLVAGCSLFERQSAITGEPILYGINNHTGDVIDRDEVPRLPPLQTTNWGMYQTGSVAGATNESPAPKPPERTSLVGVIPHKDEVVAVLVDNVFIRYLKEGATSPHVLIWTEVYDDGSDDPKNAYTRVLFNGPNQPAGVQLGMADRIIYGPVLYKGHPLRIRLFIVELDRKQKETASRIIEAVGFAASAAKPEAAPAINVAVQFAQTINAMNQDDYELRYDVTLSPVGHYRRETGKTRSMLTPGYSHALPPWISNRALDDPNDYVSNVEPADYRTLITALRTGTFAVFKREVADRYTGRGLARADSFSDDLGKIDLDYRDTVRRRVRLAGNFQEVLVRYDREVKAALAYWQEEARRAANALAAANAGAPTPNPASDSFYDAQLTWANRMVPTLESLGRHLGHAIAMEPQTHMAIITSKARYDGGYLYAVAEDIEYDVQLTGGAPGSEAFDDAEAITEALRAAFRTGVSIIPMEGPNEGRTIKVKQGRRELLRDKTYVAFSVVCGFPLGVSPESMRASSANDVQVLRSLLDTAPAELVGSQMEAKINEVTTAASTLMQKRQFSELAARRTMRDPSFRQSVDYPRFWLELLRTPTSTNVSGVIVTNQNDVALNASILSTLSDLITDLPYVRPDDSAEITRLKSLTNDLARVETENGLFRIRPQGSGP